MITKSHDYKKLKNFQKMIKKFSKNDKIFFENDQKKIQIELFKFQSFQLKR